MGNNGNQENQLVGATSATETVLEREEESNRIQALTENFNSARSEQNELGKLGKFFGGSKNASFNIIGMVALLLVATICIRWGIFGEIPPEFFFTSLMTILGYLFGKL